jgi:hypothetical protein
VTEAADNISVHDMYRDVREALHWQERAVARPSAAAITGRSPGTWPC